MIKGLYNVSMVLLAIAMRERDERLIDRLIQKNLDDREGTAMRSRIDRADTTHSPQEGSRTQNAWTLKLSNYNPQPSCCPPN